MTEGVASILVMLLGAYVVIGAVFALAFVARGAGALDPVARASSLGFRLIILPGCVALWPLLMTRWMRRGSVPVERNPHRDAAGSGS